MKPSFLLLVLAALCACESTPAVTPGTASAVAQTAAPSAATATATATALAATASTDGAPSAKDAELDKADLPVAADFEEEAEKAIDDDNLETNVDKLDKEIVAEK